MSFDLNAIRNNVYAQQAQTLRGKLIEAETARANLEKEHKILKQEHNIVKKQQGLNKKKMEHARAHKKPAAKKKK